LIARPASSRHSFIELLLDFFLIELIPCFCKLLHYWAVQRGPSAPNFLD
jgi:hypothetical protein